MQDVVLKLESIRDDQRQKYAEHLRGNVPMGKAEIGGLKWLMGRRPSVMEVVGVNRNGAPIKRSVKGRKSYAEAKTPTGTRGVYYWFTLRQGCCYHIQEQVSVRKTRRHYVIVNDGVLIDLTEQDVLTYVASAGVVVTQDANR
jgi:hypothetical protein